MRTPSFEIGASRFSAANPALRFCVIADHHENEIIEALDKLEEAAKEAGIKLPE